MTKKLRKSARSSRIELQLEKYNQKLPRMDYQILISIGKLYITNFLHAYASQYFYINCNVETRKISLINFKKAIKLLQKKMTRWTVFQINCYDITIFK